MRMGTFVQLLETIFRRAGTVTLDAQLEGRSGDVHEIPLLVEIPGRPGERPQALLVAGHEGLLGDAEFDAFLDSLHDTGADGGVLVHLGDLAESLPARAAKNGVVLWNQETLTRIVGEATLAATLGLDPPALPISAETRVIRFDTATTAASHSPSISHEPETQLETNLPELGVSTFMTADPTPMEQVGAAELSPDTFTVADPFAADSWVEEPPVEPSVSTDAAFEPAPEFLEQALPPAFLERAQAGPASDPLDPPNLLAAPGPAPEPSLRFVPTMIESDPDESLFDALEIRAVGGTPEPEPYISPGILPEAAPVQRAAPVMLPTYTLPGDGPATARTWASVGVVRPPMGLAGLAGVGGGVGGVGIASLARQASHPAATNPSAASPTTTAVSERALHALPPATLLAHPDGSTQDFTFPVLTLRVSEADARRRVKDRLFSVVVAELILHPVHLFDFELDHLKQGSLQYDTQDGRLQVHACDRSVLQVDPDVMNPGRPGTLPAQINATERVVRVQADRALELATAFVHREATRTVEVKVADHASGLYYTEKRKVAPTPDQIRLTFVATCFRPAWRLHGSNGSIDIDAVDGRELSMDARGGRTDAITME